MGSKPELNVIITMGVVTAPNCLAVVERPDHNDGDEDLDDEHEHDDGEREKQRNRIKQN